MKNTFVKRTLVLAVFATMGHAFAATTFTNEATFVTALSGATIALESFESTPGGSAASLVFPTVTVSCSGSAYCPGFFGVSSLLPTDGSQGVYYATPDTITFSFATPITAFGIDIRGLGTVGATDYSAKLSNGSSGTFFTGYTGGDAGHLFAGITDTTAFSSVTFHGTGPNDGIYFDRMQIAAVPEPETYAMLLTGLGLLGAIARRRNAKQA
jgi:hypothetical protein